MPGTAICLWALLSCRFKTVLRFTKFVCTKQFKILKFMFKKEREKKKKTA